MTSTLIVLGLVAFGVAIVAFATRRSGSGATAVTVDPDTGWNDLITPANALPTEDPFAHAPTPDTLIAQHARTSEPQS